MNYLIDTHIFLWYFDDDIRLDKKASSIIRDLSNNIFLSKISLWEITIKVVKGKMSARHRISELEKFLGDNKITLVDIQFSHLVVLEKLNLEIHSDPFDRLIVAQAIAEDFFMITDDNQLKDYPVKIFS